MTRTAEQKALRNQRDRERRRKAALAAGLTWTGKRGRRPLPDGERAERRKESQARARQNPKVKACHNLRKAVKRKLRRHGASAELQISFVTPLREFDLGDPDQRKAACAPSNVRLIPNRTQI